jgi:hypothetical protein
MEDLYSSVNKSHATAITYGNIDDQQIQQQQQYAEIDISQASTFPLVNDEAVTIDKRTRNNETLRVETKVINNPCNQIENRKNSFEVYEHQQQPVQLHQIVNHSVPIEIATENYTIKMQPASSNVNSHNLWNNFDTCLHIFLTFYFGYFASFLFFDGIIRNIEALILFDRTVFYIIYMIFAIAYLSFTVWMLTILWRWWRNKSLLPHETNYVPNVPFLKKQQTLIAKNYVFIAAIFMTIGLLIYLVLAIIDNRIRNYFSLPTTLVFIETTIIIIRLIFWLIAIIALLALNRAYFVKNFLPKRFYKKENNEQQTIIYEIRQ